MGWVLYDANAEEAGSIRKLNIAADNGLVTTYNDVKKSFSRERED
jgi:hypothetical protein